MYSWFDNLIINMQLFFTYMCCLRILTNISSFVNAGEILPIKHVIETKFIKKNLHRLLSMEYGMILSFQREADFRKFLFSPSFYYVLKKTKNKIVFRHINLEALYCLRTITLPFIDHAKRKPR